MPSLAKDLGGETGAEGRLDPQARSHPCRTGLTVSVGVGVCVWSCSHEHVHWGPARRQEVEAMACVTGSTEQPSGLGRSRQALPQVAETGRDWA